MSFPSSPQTGRVLAVMHGLGQCEAGKARGCSAESKTHHRSQCACQHWLGILGCCLASTCGDILVIWEKLAQLLALFACLLSSPGARGEAWRRIMVCLPGLSIRPRKVLSPLFAPSCCIAHPVVKVANLALTRALTTAN